MPSPTTSISTLALTALLLSRATASAQLLGCDAVGCPVDEYRTTHCEVGNATLKAIGIANMTTSLATTPLTWTLGLEELDNKNSTDTSFDRNYYLGTPPSLSLNNTAACALFFEGISANLTAPTAAHLDKYTCSDSLGESCVADLTAQAQRTFALLGSTTDNDGALCSQLRDALASQPPSTCNGVRGSWGAVTARALPPALSTPPIADPKCHPTTGQGYTLRLISSSRTSAQSRELRDLSPILNAVTPVMTVFGKGRSEVGAAAEPEVALTCLALVEGVQGRTVDGPVQEAGAGAVVRAGAGVWVGMVVATWVWYVLV